MALWIQVAQRNDLMHNYIYCIRLTCEYKGLFVLLIEHGIVALPLFTTLSRERKTATQLVGWIVTLRTFCQNAPIAYWLVNSGGAFMKMYSVSTQESSDQWTMQRPACWLQLAWKSDGGLLCCHRGRLEREDKRSPEATGEVEVTLYFQYSGDRESLSWTEKKNVEHSLQEPGTHSVQPA